MAYKIFRKGGYFYIVDTVTGRERDGLTKNVRVTRGTTSADVFYINGVNDWSNGTAIPIASIQNEFGVVYSVTDFITFYESANSQDVNIQDQTSSPLLVYMNRVIGATTLTAPTVVDEYTVSVTSVAGMSAGDYCGIFNQTAGRFYQGVILSIDALVITFDNPLDFAYQIDDVFQNGSKELAVNGSETPVVFSLRADPELPITADITRIIFHITDQTAMDDAKFGGIGALTNGVVLRRKDGYYQNIFNVKTNGEIGELAFDKVYDDKAPAGFYGFSSRLTFGGQNKIGVVIRLKPDEDLQIIIQDDLTGLDSFKIMVEGHIVV